MARDSCVSIGGLYETELPQQIAVSWKIRVIVKWRILEDLER